MGASSPSLAGPSQSILPGLSLQLPLLGFRPCSQQAPWLLCSQCRASQRAPSLTCASVSSRGGVLPARWVGATAEEPYGEHMRSSRGS